ncbi:membrane protein insertase YidC [Hugenholtzia roseola]|uniref:membrane protein insertase YidC n=1 Tax=Hugenholtzia roseola TaxID=1002 RepID=UPI0004059FE7|nr:membrane protein insertase YidC [Hugenholtzia roseola]
MEKNQVVGLVVLTAMLVFYMLFLSPQPNEEKTQQTQPISADSLTQKADLPQQEISQVEKLLQTLSDSALSAQLGDWAAGIKGEEKLFTIENQDLSLTFSNKGGKIKSATLKQYKDYLGNELLLFDAQSSRFQWSLPLKKEGLPLESRFFEAQVSDDKKSITFSLLLGGKAISQTFSIDEKGYQVSYQADFDAIQDQIATPALALDWQYNLRRLEKDLDQSRRQSTVNFYTNEGDFDQLPEASTSKEEEQVEGKIKWFALKQRFFNAALIAETGMEKAAFTSSVETDNQQVEKSFTAKVSLPLAALKPEAKTRFYFGPNDYLVCQQVSEGFENNVYLGWKVLSPISYVILHLFNFLANYISNYGVIIIVMVLLIKLLLSPLTYKAYLSQARMKVVQPELNAIREKYPDDMSKQSQEQMKLYGELGVNPLSGCIPMLLQMPIFLSLFTFFPSIIQLRGANFLWSADLSTYDSILDLPFSIPFYGAHISLFTVLMTASQIAVTAFGGQTPTTPANSPINMKFMIYGLPVIFMFVLNSFPSGLTLYYLVSNLITISQNVLIRKFFVNEEKIKAILDKRRQESATGSAKKSKFRQRLDDALRNMQDAAQEAQSQNQTKRQAQDSKKADKNSDKNKKK